MVQKLLCDVCGAEIPNAAVMEHNEHVKHPSGVFHFGAVVVDEYDDLCIKCGGLVRDYIRSMKKGIAPSLKENIPDSASGVLQCLAADLTEINELPWRTFVKGSEPGSAKKGYLTTEGPNARDRPGWIFTNEAPKLHDALAKEKDELEIGDWTFFLRGTGNNLINRSKKK